MYEERAEKISTTLLKTDEKIRKQNEESEKERKRKQEENSHDLQIKVKEVRRAEREALK